MRSHDIRPRTAFLIVAVLYILAALIEPCDGHSCDKPATVSAQSTR